MADASSSCNKKLLHEYIADYFYSAYLALRRNAFTKPEYKAAIYWLIVVVGSFIQQFFPLPKSYLSYRKNVFNIYFVKIGWGWTWSLLSLLSVMCTLIITSGNVVKMMRHYGRLLVATMAWFCWVRLFEYIEHLTGTCSGEPLHNSKLVCHRNGFFWQGFDISGHAFLLIHCSLTISEEIQVVKYLENKIKESYSQSPSGFKAQYWYKLLWPFIHVTFLCTALLVILWEFMLVVTSLYFHTVQQKLLGAIFAIVSWWGTYKYWYQQDEGLFLQNLKQ